MSVAPLITGSLLVARDGYGCHEVVPGGYVSLMDLHENNYLRFRKLVADLDAITDWAISVVPGHMDLHLQILERSKFTTTVRMTYYFSDHQKLVAEPDLKIRVYHDACLVEVLAGHLKHGRQRLDHLPTTAPRLKWRLNRFLYKWLGYCLHLGHEFSETTACEPVKQPSADGICD
ncbi:MAG: DUF1249 domain-containing protein [Gammaproteobacteria bacterium]|nr:DUF1249 domain-containing protein [Gammaproteobacteria bacterium]MCW8922293.1 DUF1249 domain-containing protein [Gammaproteobacteria bacterium]